VQLGFLHIETGHPAQIGASSLTRVEVGVADGDLESNEILTLYVPFRNADLLSMATSSRPRCPDRSVKTTVSAREAYPW